MVLELNYSTHDKNTLVTVSLSDATPKRDSFNRSLSFSSCFSSFFSLIEVVGSAAHKSSAITTDARSSWHTLPIGLMHGSPYLKERRSVGVDDRGVCAAALSVHGEGGLTPPICAGGTAWTDGVTRGDIRSVHPGLAGMRQACLPAWD